jgi:hypothetical protein
MPYRRAPLGADDTHGQVWDNPNGLPMAITHSPISRSSESPKGSDRQIVGPFGPDQGNIGFRICSNDFCFELPSIL